MAGVYWQGNNGNLYVKGAGFDGVKDLGAYDQAIGIINQGQYGIGPYVGYTGIGTQANVPAAPANNNQQLAPEVTGGGSGGGASQFVDTSAARATTQGQIDSLGRQHANMDASAQAEYDQLIAQYGEENAANEANYTGQVTKNENVRSGGISQSLASAAQGGKGLRASLAAMGALGGTGSLLANRAVASSANKDVGGVNETFDTNAENLNSAWKQTEREQRQRKSDADSSLVNAKTRNAGKIAEQRQSAFEKMAGFWEQAGNKGEATNWLSKMGGENAAIEAASRTATPGFQRASAAFSPQALKNYLAGGQDMSVEAAPAVGGPGMPGGNGAIYASPRTRREEYA
jgi:hypothetical protein